MGHDGIDGMSGTVGLIVQLKDYMLYEYVAVTRVSEDELALAIK